jgi:peptidyl-prolyl cis-trans isomerase A (cyclophilin A)
MSEVAILTTSAGEMVLEFWPDVAPGHVENFKKLAQKGFYDGTAFHRVIKGFMIQGGDAKGDGSGEAGYVIPDEVWVGAHHDHAGELCMANRGANTNSAQFFITDAAAAHLDHGYTIFGECEPEGAIHMIASVAVTGEHPTSPVTIRKITITRSASSGAVPFAGAPLHDAGHD